MNDFKINFIYNSNAIEGNTLSLEETKKVLNNEIIKNKTLQEHKEVYGLNNAFEYVEQLAEQKIQITENIIKNIHSLLLLDKPNDRGIYRKVPVAILGSLHKPPQPFLITMQMENLMLKKVETIEDITKFHLDFENIHPFIDGNGRTGRLIINLQLMNNGFKPIYITLKDQNKYYDAFNHYNQTKDISKMFDIINQKTLEK